MKKKPARRRRAASLSRPPRCKHFTGYKPCFPGTRCDEQCVDFDPIGTRILLINLDAMGNVLATTSILPALKRKYPHSTITWITEKRTAALLQHNPHLDRIFTWEPESWLVLQQLTFDVVLNVDKSRRSGALAMSVRAKTKLGFGMNADGQIIPLTKDAHLNYRMGLDDELKFHRNTKTLNELQCGQFRLPFRRDEYVLALTTEEREFAARYAREQGLTEGSPLVVGLNTGCSELYPNKKMTIDQHVALIGLLGKIPRVKVLLLGGPEDTVRNAEIARQAGSRVLSTPTTEGLRRGLCYVDLCDVVVTGDSFGMHAAIGLRKFVIVWFGVSCAAEIDLFDRGVKLIPEGLSCSPCWKHECPYNLECVQLIDLERIAEEVGRFADRRTRN
ncbi:MAG TPA: glycosyltransferase family 9 protein [Bacteroidota bacterium]|nr:glycosyltransferase family 9 protein [Bacteroidota bacterium]